MLDLTIPLAFESSTILHGLLALSESCSNRSALNLEHYHLAVSELSKDIAIASMGSTSMGHIHRVLAASLLLCIFCMGYCDGTAIQHLRGMIGVVRWADRNLLASSDLGCFLMGTSAFLDISALSIGSGWRSQKAWINWLTRRPAGPPGQSFTPLEITMGYPENFVDILAQVSDFADDQAQGQLIQLLVAASTPNPDPQNPLRGELWSTGAAGPQKPSRALTNTDVCSQPT